MLKHLSANILRSSRGLRRVQRLFHTQAPLRSDNDNVDKILASEFENLLPEQIEHVKKNLRLTNEQLARLQNSPVENEHVHDENVLMERIADPSQKDLASPKAWTELNADYRANVERLFGSEAFQKLQRNATIDSGLKEVVETFNIDVEDPADPRSESHNTNMQGNNRWSKLSDKLDDVILPESFSELAPPKVWAPRFDDDLQLDCFFCLPDPTGQGSNRLDYTNVDALIKFVNERGMISSRRENGCCAKHQRHLQNEIKRARRIGLMSHVSNWTVNTKSDYVVETVEEYGYISDPDDVDLNSNEALISEEEANDFNRSNGRF